MDNYYDSFGLAKTLPDQGTHCTGTLRLDRKNNPEHVKGKKLQKGETVSCYAEGVMIGKWRDKRDVGYISTEYENNMVEIESRRGEKNGCNKKPIASSGCIPKRPKDHKLVKRDKKQVSRKRCNECSKEGKRIQTSYECRTYPGLPGYCVDCSDIIQK
ncbi:hypothetical protein JTB14_032821 [Gonioctena quinquepunctata]|nr:hypothetical protein JTB14_032821 [Gonioctena quinquepunctata]